jgi:hypothetical protein
MRIMTFKNNWVTTTALLLVFPSAYFVVIGVLAASGISGPLDAIRPLAEDLGIKDPPGFNITSLILFGPVIAILLTVFQFMKLEWRITKEEVFVHFSFYKRWFPILVTAAGAVVLAFLFLYMFLENCNCH